MRVGLTAFPVLALLWTTLASGHPLGNNTVNRLAAITVSGTEVNIAYHLDLAEIPTLLASQQADTDSDGTVLAAEWSAYAERWARDLLPALHLDTAASALALQISHARWQLVDGAAGLSQLRLQADFRAAAPPLARASLRYVDSSRPDEAGWREVWVDADHGAQILNTQAARHDRSAGLTRFPPSGTPLLNETEAAFAVEFGAPMAALPEPLPAVPSAFAPTTIRAPTALSMFLLGVHHIATGWDHLVFLLGLLLLSRSLRDLLVIVTAFTLSHSLTLALAASGLVTPPGTLVEPAIALTIAYVGLCNLYFRGRGHGLPLAFGFGLVHGFGFAGALAETLGAHGAQGYGWLWGLAAFNLGIEGFQVLLLCAVVPLARWASRRSFAPLARRGAAHGVLWAGLGWFALRVVGV